jgi:hypothetical protein
MKTLLLSQRVNKHWKSSITESTRLQKKLFFTAALPADLLKLRIADTDPDGYTMMVANTTFGEATHGKLGFAGIAMEDYSQTNPFFPGDVLLTAGFTGQVMIGPRFKLPAINPGHKQVRPSWMRMLVTQPPDITCGIPNIDCRFGVAQNWFSHFGTEQAPYHHVLLNGTVMRGKYYWDAVKRKHVEASSKKAEIGQSEL